MKVLKKSNGSLEFSGPFFPEVSEFYPNFFEPFYWCRKYFANLPAANIREYTKEFIVEIAALGMTKHDFKITIDDGILSVYAEKKQRKEEEDETYRRREYNYNSFSRSFSLPETVKKNDISAKYEEGILKFT